MLRYYASSQIYLLEIWNEPICFMQEVEELVLQNMRPEICRQVGINPPCGFMLHGPSGCGKTFLVNAIAGVNPQ